MISKSEHIVPLTYGPGASMRTGKIAREFGVTKAIIVCDQGVKKAGIVDKIVASLEGAGLEYTVFDGVIADPPDSVVEAAGELARSEKVNGVIAVGGGSAMDAAKCVNVLINNPSPITQWCAPSVPTQDGVPLIMVPTTAGTGSEGTYGAVVTDTRMNRKRFVASRTICLANMAIVDPELYVGMPEYPTVACAFDAYTHAFDSICSAHAEPITEMFSKECLRLVCKYLPQVIEDGTNIEARGGLALAATYSGYAINSIMCHLTHLYGHTFGLAFHLPHGHCCAFVMPQIAELYAKILPDRLKIVAECIGLELPGDISNEELGKTVKAAIQKFMKECGLKSLKELGYKKEEVMALVPVVTSDVAIAYVPQGLPLSKFASMLDEAYDQ